jgi:hypothetical protein|tara:strand:+ start:9252 stop:10136 length:885 start_codon:yes stop_codon:yes gene_type:complete
MAAAAAPRVDPKLLGFGDTFGSYGGRLLGDTDIWADAIDGSKLNVAKLGDPIEFNPYEETIKSFILGRLGHPVVRVELTDFQIKTAIDEAVSNLDYHAPFWCNQLATFQCSGGVNAYILPTHIANNLNYCVYKKSLLSIQNMAGTLEFDFFIKYFQDNFLFSNFSVSDFYLLQQSLETMRKVLSQDGSWDIINGNLLVLYPTPVLNTQTVILSYRGLDSATMHPYYKNWIQRFALACAKEILGEIRGKYKTLPSPGGGAVLNGGDLMKAATEEKKLLKEQLLSEIEEPPAFSTY